MLNSVSWANFKLSDLFEEIKISKSLNKNQLVFSDDKNSISYITRSSVNNGLLGKVYSDKVNLESFKVEGDCLTVAMVGESFTTFYQKDNFITSQNIAILRNKNLTKYEYFFLIPILEKEMYRYGYGRTLNITHLRNTKIKLPMDNEGEPNWVFMREYIKTLSNNNLEDFHKPKYTKIKELNRKEWVDFKLSDLFEIKRGISLPIKKQESGNIPLISSTSLNNGVSQYVKLSKQNTLYKAKSITLAINGSVGETYYQPDDFYATGDVAVLNSEYINSYTGLFLSTILRLEKKRYTYGRKWTLSRIQNTIIKLPVDKEGNPDWQFMEDYIKSLPYTKHL